MSAVVPFEFEGAPVRSVVVDGEPFLVGKDVAERLGYADPTTAIRSHCRGVQKLHPIADALGRAQEVRILSEPDVLRLIMGSKLPAAERFERWVFEEVLPAIRRQGGYIAAAPEETDEDLVMRAMAVLRATVDRQKAQLAAKAEQLAIAEPKAEALERIARADGAPLSLTVAAKVLQVAPKWFFQWMQRSGWIYRRPGNSHFVGYQERLAAGLLWHKITTVNREDGSEKVVEQVMVTPKGLAKLSELLSRPGVAPPMPSTDAPSPH